MKIPKLHLLRNIFLKTFLLSVIFLVPSTSHASWLKYNKQTGDIIGWTRYTPPGCDCGPTGTEALVELPGEQEVDMRLQKYDLSSNTVVQKNAGEVEKYDMREKRQKNRLQSLSFTSSVRYKENIEDTSFNLENFMKLKTRQFTWKDDGQSDMGFIAEEVAELIPDLVVKNEDGTIEGVRYDRIPLYLFEVVKQHTSRLDALDGGLSSIATSTTAEGPDNAWSVDQQSGKVNVNFFGDINMQGNSIRDVTSISGMFNKWKIDGDGILTAVKVVTEKLEAENVTARKGVTVLDQDSSSPYCITVRGGAVIAASGECSTSQPSVTVSEGSSTEESAGGSATTTTSE